MTKKRILVTIEENRLISTPVDKAQGLYCFRTIAFSSSPIIYVTLHQDSNKKELVSLIYLQVCHLRTNSIG